MCVSTGKAGIFSENCIVAFGAGEWNLHPGRLQQVPLVIFEQPLCMRVVTVGANWSGFIAGGEDLAVDTVLCLFDFVRMALLARILVFLDIVTFTLGKQSRVWESFDRRVAGRAVH